jgi:hypothetical protein
MDSAGLVCFCYASQNHIVAVVVLILTAFCTFGLGAVSLWFIAERWAYSRHQGTRWLADVVEENWGWLFRVSGLGHFTRAVIAVWRMLLRCPAIDRSALCTCCVRLRWGHRHGVTAYHQSRSAKWRLALHPQFFCGVTTRSAGCPERPRRYTRTTGGHCVSRRRTTRISEDTMNNGSVSVRPAHTRAIAH